MHYMTAEKLAASKSVLAKLLASENIDVVHKPNIRTAYFDLKNRIVVCPVWKDMKGYLYDLLLSHEVGHALYTNQNDWTKALKKHDRNFQGFLNVIEDVRIEKLMKRKFPGLNRSYIQGNKWLIDSGFFGKNAKSTKKINSMGLIDRINLHFRVDETVNIHFSSKEMPFVKRAERLSTWKDVYELAKDIYEFQKQESETSKNDLEQGKDNSGEQDDSGDNEGSGDAKDENGESNDQNDESSGDQDEDGNEDSNGDEDDTEADTDGSGFNEGDDTDEDDEGDTVKSKGSGGDPKSETDEAYRQNQDSLVSNEYNENIENIVIPDIDPKHYLVTFDKVLKGLGEYKVDQLEKEKNKLKNNLKEHKDSIDYLVKEFEMKKAADQHKRTKVSKTGVIDPTLLHSYRFNDDIFMRSSTVTEGKNHGLIIYVDWSGSMQEKIKYALDQVMILVRFCQKVNIPYGVYAFQDGGGFKNTVTQQKENELKMNGFSLIELISSDLKKGEVKKAFNLLQKLKTTGGDFGPISLHTTPLDQAVMTMGPMYRRFQKKYNVDVLNTVFLTDGGSSPTTKINNSFGEGGYISRATKDNPYYMTDAYTKTTSVYTDTDLTMALVDKMKKVYNMNVMNFHVVDSSHDVNMMPALFNVLNVGSGDVMAEGYATGKSTLGFDDVYVVNPKTIKNVTKGNDVNSRTKNRKKKRLMLNQFTEKIS